MQDTTYSIENESFNSLWYWFLPFFFFLIGNLKTWCSFWPQSPDFHGTYIETSTCIKEKNSRRKLVVEKSSLNNPFSMRYVLYASYFLTYFLHQNIYLKKKHTHTYTHKKTILNHKKYWIFGTNWQNNSGSRNYFEFYELISCRAKTESSKNIFSFIWWLSVKLWIEWKFIPKR